MKKTIHCSASCGGVGIVSNTRFWMFDLSREMTRRGWDVHLFTATPRRFVDKGAARKVHFHMSLSTAEQVLLRAGRLGRYIQSAGSMPLGKWGRRDLSRWVCRYLDSVEIVDALSGWGLECGRFLQKRGGRYVCNRGSAHILFQKAIMEEEFARWRMPAPRGFPDWGVERELEEYDAADAVAVPSGFVRSSFVAQGVAADKLYVCPYGVDLSLFSPRLKRDDKFRILFVGTASIRKGVGYLLKAVQPLIAQGHAELWLVGAIAADGEPLLAKNQDLFSHKGPFPRSELADIYSQGSVLVLPSVEEGLAMVQPQAMACGLPVIATHQTGAEDLFEDGREGFIIPARDPAAIRERLEWLIDHPSERDAMGRAALERTRTLGGWEAYGERVERMYLNLKHGKSTADHAEVRAL